MTVVLINVANQPVARVLICSSGMHAEDARKQLAAKNSKNIVSHLSDDLSVVAGRRVVLLLKKKAKPDDDFVKSLIDKGATSIRAACIPEVEPEGFDPIRHVKENSEAVWSRPEVAAAAPAQVAAPVDADPAPVQVPPVHAEPVAEPDADADLEAANEAAWRACQEDADGTGWEEPATPALTAAQEPETEPGAANDAAPASIDAMAGTQEEAVAQVPVQEAVAEREPVAATPKSGASKPRSFAAFVAERYTGPDAVLAAFLDDAVAAAAEVGAELNGVPELDDCWHYLPSLETAKSEHRHSYRGDLIEHNDGVVLPGITFKTFKEGGKTIYWSPREALWLDYETSKSGAVLQQTEDRSAQYAARAKGLQDEVEAVRASEDQAASANIARRRVRLRDDLRNCDEATSDQDYIARKKGRPDGLKEVSWPMRGWGKFKNRTLEGWAAVPAYEGAGNTGDVMSAQFIGPNKGEKLNAPLPIKGYTHTIGKVEQGKPGYIIEGIGHAWSINAVTGHPAVVSFGASNMEAAARAAQEVGILPVILVPDRGQEAAAARIAARLGCSYAPLPADLPDGADVNDLYLECGADEVRAVLDAPIWPQAPAPAAPPDDFDGAGSFEEWMNGANPPPAPGKKRKAATRDAIADINKQHAVTLMGDKVVVLRESVGDRGGKELLFMSVGAFKTWHMNQFVPWESTNAEGVTTTKLSAVADLWLKSSERRQYEGVTFAPANDAPPSHYNLWSGYAVEPLDCDLLHAAMKCRRLLSHMKYNLCGGERVLFRYLLAWAADMLQDPDQKKGVALVLRGKKGTGKSKFADVLKRLLDRHAIKVAHMRHLTGNFNRHLADKLLIVAEESFWAGDKSDEGPLKDMITSETLTVEAKGIDAVEMRSLCRVMMITNNDWAVPATNDERRYFVLDVSERRRKDFKYFAAIDRQLNDGGLCAFLTLLLRLPLQAVNLRAVPETRALRRQRSHSLEPHDQFVYDAIADGALLGKEWRDVATVSKDFLYDAYIESSRKRGKTHLLSKEAFGSKFMHSTGARPTRLWNGGDRLQAYKMPSRLDAAATFAERLGVDVALSEPDEESPL